MLTALGRTSKNPRSRKLLAPPKQEDGHLRTMGGGRLPHSRTAHSAAQRPKVSFVLKPPTKPPENLRCGPGRPEG